MRHGVPVGHVESEEEYFHRRDAELIDEMSKHAAAEQERRLLAEASRIDDPKTLHALERLGYTHTTVVLLPLVPLIELAWIDGTISPIERNGIVAMAVKCGIAETSPAHGELMAWLDRRPTAEFFEETWRAIEMMLASAPEGERLARKRSLIEDCQQFAVASCERFGWASRICKEKRKLLQAIAFRLSAPHKPLHTAAHTA